jgi:hypothetical protein
MKIEKHVMSVAPEPPAIRIEELNQGDKAGPPDFYGVFRK